jgi:hypothetical protein
VRFIRGPLALALLCIAVLSSCGGDDNGTSPASLKNDLIPPSEFPGFTKVARSFDWDDPIDFAVQGLPQPETTPPSDSVKAMEDAGFEAAVGEELVTAKGGFEGPHGQVVAAQLGSDGEALDALDYARKEALKQPCFAVCSVQSKEFTVAGIPGAKGVQQTPMPKPPPEAPPPFASYGIGFTIGPRFFLTVAGGAPGEVKKSQVLDAAKALYARNTKS